MLSETSAPAWLQAGAAVASLIVTGWLVWLTRGYLKETRKMAAAAQAQVDRMYEAAAEDEARQHRRLGGAIGLFQRRVASLPETGQDFLDAKRIETWPAPDIDHLLEPVRGVEKVSLAEANGAADALRQLTLLIEAKDRHLTATPRTGEAPYTSTFNRTLYSLWRETATKALAQLGTELSLVEAEAAARNQQRQRLAASR